MKLTKIELRQIIKEEVKRLNESIEVETLADKLEDKFGDYAWDWTDDAVFVTLGEEDDDPTIEVALNDKTDKWDVFLAKTNYTKPTKMIASGLTKIGEITRAVRKAFKDPIIKKFEEDMGW